MYIVYIYIYRCLKWKKKHKICTVRQTRACAHGKLVGNACKFTNTQREKERKVRSEKARRRNGRRISWKIFQREKKNYQKKKKRRLTFARARERERERKGIVRERTAEESRARIGRRRHVVTLARGRRGRRRVLFLCDFFFYARRRCCDFAVAAAFPADPCPRPPNAPSAAAPLVSHVTADRMMRGWDGSRARCTSHRAFPGALRASRSRPKSFGKLFVRENTRHILFGRFSTIF